MGEKLFIADKPTLDNVNSMVSGSPYADKRTASVGAGSTVNLLSISGKGFVRSLYYNTNSNDLVRAELYIDGNLVTTFKQYDKFDRAVMNFRFESSFELKLVSTASGTTYSGTCYTYYTLD